MSASACVHVLLYTCAQTHVHLCMRREEKDYRGVYKSAHKFEARLKKPDGRLQHIGCTTLPRCAVPRACRAVPFAGLGICACRLFADAHSAALAHDAYARERGIVVGLNFPTADEGMPVCRTCGSSSIGTKECRHKECWDKIDSAPSRVSIQEC